MCAGTFPFRRSAGSGWLGGLGRPRRCVHAKAGPLQSEAQRGTPLSAGCVRQRYSDAQGLYAWAPVGTTVAVVK